jgi:GNAT superfamily N-acetyltransferase
MDQLSARATFDEQLRRRPRERFERVGAVLRRVGETPDDWSGIDGSDLDESSADAAIAEQVAYFGRLGRRFEWKYYSHDQPADLPQRLRRAGFEPDEAEALMVADVTDVPTDLAPPDGVELRAITDADGVHALVEVHRVVFGIDDSGLARDLLTRVGSESFAGVVAMAGDRPVSSARMEFHPGTDFASLWGGATVQAWRGKGIYRAMVAHRARLAAERGCRYLRVDALPTSRPILERLGFAQLATTVPYVFTPRRA